MNRSTHRLPLVRTIGSVAIMVLAGGCYHATVNTGVAPGAAPVKEWKHSWIGGLVPPSKVDAVRICGENEVARIETKLSFVNRLVAILTASIYTPMEVTVTCGLGNTGSAPSPVHRPRDRRANANGPDPREP